MTEAQTQTSTPVSPEIAHTPEEVFAAINKGELPPPTSGKGKEGFEALRKGKVSESQITEEDIQKPEMIMDRELKQRAERVLQNLRATDLYLQALERIKRERLSSSNDQNTVVEALTGQGRNLIEKQVLDFLSSQPAIRALFRGKGDDKVRKTLSTLISTQPQFREALLRMTKDALAGFESLPKVSDESRDLEKKRIKKKELEEARSKLKQHLIDVLGVSNDEFSEIISSRNHKIILSRIIEAKTKKLTTSLDGNSLAKAIELISSNGSFGLLSIEQEIERLGKEIIDLNQQKREIRPRFMGQPKEVRDIDEMIVTKQEKIRRLGNEMRRLQSLKDSLKNNGQAISQIDEIARLRIGLSSLDSGQQQNPNTILLEIDELFSTGENIERLTEEIEASEAKLKEKKSELVARKIAERDLVEGLETVANDSFVEFLEEKAREMAKKDEEKRNKESDEALRRFDEALSKRYVEFNSALRRYIYHRSTTGRDMRLLASGDEGGKIIVARILLNNNTLISLDTLKSEELSQVEKVYQQRGADLRKRLMTDYFRQRTFFDRSFIKFNKFFSKEVLFEGGFGDLRITDAEWGEIGRHFGSEIDAALEASKQGQEVLRQLKEKGININWNLKWLLYLLLIGFGIRGGIALISFLKNN